MKVTENTQQHRFELPIADEALAAAYYRLENGRVVLIHTEIPLEFSGQGSRRSWRTALSSCCAKPAAKQSRNARSWTGSSSRTRNIQTFLLDDWTQFAASGKIG
ncbi:GNAT family N-acetyltransferase [Mesorhizobium escarrei]|uniref:Uncharacterized protein n=1 Tax=Mesorhizobium escarrei TaxID=666018 RepID=A0ABN8JKG1_9HYPH|nr:hypothetical protein MES5069_200058 [Mesorhizobium escarrei]